MTVDEEKKLAAEKAISYITPGMKVGLGSGSTSAVAVRLLGEKMKKEGWTITGVPTSESTRQLAESLGIPLATLAECPELDLTIDGADEFDPYLNLIKGGGGAMLREKVVAHASRELIIMVDSRKKVDVLGAFPLPVEVVPFAAARVSKLLTEKGCNPEVRKTAAGETYLTDQQNMVLDCCMGKIASPFQLAAYLDNLPGVVEHGLFLDMTTRIIMANNGEIIVVES